MTQFDLSSGNYNEADASNNNPGAAGWAIGQAPSNVGAAGRAFMGSVKRAYDWDHGGTWAAVTGTANAIVITYPVAPNAYVQGQKHVFKATAANTGAATVNINSLGAKNIYAPLTSGPAALIGGEIQVGQLVEIEYDGTEFVLVSPIAYGTGAGQAVRLDASARLPAVDASQLTNLMPAGAVIPYAGSTAPNGWLLAAGQAISRTTYAALFAAISTTYGVGDGSTTFNVPDLRGRFAAGADNMGGSAAGRLGSNSSTGGISGTASLGVAGGAQTHVQTVAELAQHSHPISSDNNAMNVVDYNQAGANALNGGSVLAVAIGPNTLNTGSNSPFNITPPTLVLNYIIKT